ncbi:MAG: DNA protecting protein DprA [Rhodospirillales bacterium RIFCSPLOWO2_12_FULL_58_28]|nr:MAG: DNA protecting protein DprA [Rhodospirillales bacterium RIFCSPLOWO2_02_FULL_58_16]OHC76944.1 MAG: DNA protecting protein DprA [Rhodospirillales bacterium RIFCSPLOWO2_12_FULL_58_28]
MDTRDLTSTEKLDWLRLIRSENVGPITFYRLLERFGSAFAAIRALPEMARRGGRSKDITVCPAAAAEREMEALAKLGAVFIARIEPAYPPLLAHIEDAPPLISVLGNVHLLKKKAVGVVGARNASYNGMRFTRKLAGDLGSNGLLVVSGLARGIDAGAHEGALDTGTAAVVAGGVDIIYPRENAELYARIVERGVVVSECAPGESPTTRHFPRRNRLISGISRGVVVIEAARRSGSLITARTALEQNREVFAVPGSPMDPRVGGANDLIRQGAVLTESADDVMRVLDDLFRSPLAERKAFDFSTPPPSVPDDGDLNKARLEIEQILGPDPVMVDEIIRNCQMSTAVVSMVLLELELAGRLERHSGNQVSLVWT